MTGTVLNVRISELRSFNLDSLTCNIILYNCEHIDVITHGPALDGYLGGTAGNFDWDLI